MARSFIASSSQYLEKDSAPVTVFPFTMATWAYANDAASRYMIMSIVDKEDTQRRAYFRFAGEVGGDPIRLFVRDGGANEQVDTSTGFSANTWHHICGVFASNTSKSIYLDAGGKVTGPSPVGPNSWDRISLGRILEF